MKEIYLVNGGIALVDDEDYERINQYPWAAHKSYQVTYAVRRGRKGRSRPYGMHSMIMNAVRGETIDHINGNGLDNRKSNLRKATVSQNQQNRLNLTRNTSGYRGVTWNKDSKKWQAGIKHMGRSYHLGLFEQKEDAARAYDVKARELFGEFARPNFPENEKKAA